MDTQGIWSEEESCTISLERWISMSKSLFWTWRGGILRWSSDRTRIIYFAILFVENFNQKFGDTAKRTGVPSQVLYIFKEQKRGFKKKWKNRII